MEKYLIVGLGNPGLQYENTKHNVGFLTIDKICQKLEIFLDKEKFNGIFSKIIIDDKEVFIAKPYTYMNSSGSFVRDLCNFFKISLNNIIVIYDDIDTEIGKIRVRAKGSSGGQNGIKNIIQLLGSENIKRIRIGIGKAYKNDLSSYVLSNFSKEQKLLINNSIDKAALAAIDFIKKDNFEHVISLYN